MALYTYPGNIHVHSTYSDGSGSIKEIASDAARAGLSFVMITDHETLEGLAEEGLHRKVVILVGMEINRSSNHYLAFDLERPAHSNEDCPQEVIDEVNRQGGFGIMAHPFEKGSPYLEKGQAYPWINWPVFGFTGLEIWNYSSHWRGLHPSLLRTIYHFFFNRKAAMRGAPPELLALWDCYNRSGHRVIGIGGSDAHAFNYRLGFIDLQIFSYQFIFGTINTYLQLKEELAEDFKMAKTQILSAIKDGRSYISFDSLAKGIGFNFYAACGEKRYLMGSALTYTPGLVLEAEAPVKRAFFRLVRNGRVIYTGSGNKLHFLVQQPGVYRLEVFYKTLLGRPRPWIYSNPIFINKGG